MKGNIQFYHGRGKLGNSVGYTLYGQQMFRAYVGKGEVSNPKSEAQVLQRAKIKLLTELSIRFRGAARLGFSDEARNRGCSAVNFFVHRNYPEVQGTSAESVSINPAKIVCAQGNVPGVVFSSTIGVTTPGVINLTITDINAEVEGASTEDLIYGVAYCPDAGACVLSAGVHRTSDAVLTIRVPQSWSGLEVHVYGFVTNPEKASSNSDYIGHAELG